MKKVHLKIRAYSDLMRLHFAGIWPLLFCSGAVLAFERHGGFRWSNMFLIALIGLFGFETGMVWNDVLDYKSDAKDVEFDRLTRYWRPFGRRPIPTGLLTLREAIIFVIILLTITIVLIGFLPMPQRFYLYLMMPLTYGLETFYNLKKRKERLPWAQLIGRLDLTLFPVAGYLTVSPALDLTPLLFMGFFYPLAQVHLAVNDLVDLPNDKVRELNTVTTLYGIKGTLWWIIIFSIWHLIAVLFFLTTRQSIAYWGFGCGFFLLILADTMIVVRKTPLSALRALPLIHGAILIYILTIILDVVI